jgi:hypothetical protein
MNIARYDILVFRILYFSVSTSFSGESVLL